MINNIINSQYIYVNSFNRSSTDKTSDLSIDFSDGMIKCNPETESLAITATNFSITKNWYYINETNDYLKIVSPTNEVFTYNIERSNYTFKKLAKYITEIVPFPISMKWDADKNKYIIDMPDGYKLDFTANNSCWYILGFNKGDIITKQPNISIISTNILNIYLSRTINVNIENITPDKNVSTIENSVNNIGKPSTCIMSMVNDFPPYTTLDFQNQNDLFRINIKEKSINKLRFTVRDEYKNLMNFITDWNLVLKIDTYSTDNSMQNKTLSALQNIEDYLRMSFVNSNLNKI